MWWGGLITLRTDAPSNLCEAPSMYQYIHISLSLRPFKAHRSMPTWPPFTPSHETMSVCFLGFFVSKDDEKSVVSLTRCYSTQYSKASPHRRRRRPALLYSSESHPRALAAPALRAIFIFVIFYFLFPALSRSRSARWHQQPAEPNEVGLNTKNELN